MSSISSDNYQHAQRVWKEFRIHNLGDYHYLYLRTDVVLLANVYEAFKSGIQFDENLTGCEMGKIKVVIKRPVYLGQVILDLSKIVMYKFHYDYMKPKYDGENSHLRGTPHLKLCYMDTDSLVYEITTKDFYVDIKDDVPAGFDTSGYCDNWSLPISLNKKVIRLMKDKLGEAIMTEFMALRPKLCSYEKLDGSEDKKCKLIKKCIVKKTLTF